MQNTTQYQAKEYLHHMLHQHSLWEVLFSFFPAQHAGMQEDPNHQQVHQRAYRTVSISISSIVNAKRQSGFKTKPSWKEGKYSHPYSMLRTIQEQNGTPHYPCAHIVDLLKYTLSIHLLPLPLDFFHAPLPWYPTPQPKRFTKNVYSLSDLRWWI